MRCCFLHEGSSHLIHFPLRSVLFQFGCAHCPLGCVLCLPGCVLCPLGSVLCSLRTVLCPLKAFLCPLRSIFCPLESVLCPLRSVLCPLRSVLCPLRSVLCPLGCVLRPLLDLCSVHSQVSPLSTNTTICSTRYFTCQMTGTEISTVHRPLSGLSTVCPLFMQIFLMSTGRSAWTLFIDSSALCLLRSF